jgi:hypothetical protein
MTNLPRLFDERGAFIEPSEQVIAGLDEQTRQRLDAVRAAYSDLLIAQTDEKAATDEIANSVQALDDAEAYRKTLYQEKQHDQWIDNFGNADQRRALALRRAGRA